MFQHTAARRRLGLPYKTAIEINRVSTHSRPKAAGNYVFFFGVSWAVSTHSRPKAAGSGLSLLNCATHVSTHSRPKAAGLVCATFRVY